MYHATAVSFESDGLMVVMFEIDFNAITQLVHEFVHLLLLYYHELTHKQLGAS